MLMSKDIYFDRIESYVEGTNPPEQKRQFEKDLEDDPSLKEEYQAYLATQRAVENLALDQVRAKVAEVAQRQPETAKIFKLNRRIIAIAAGFLVLIAALTFLYGRQQYSDQNLFAQQYEAPNWSPIRGATAATAQYDQAILSLQKGNRKEAITGLSAIAKTDEVYANAQYTLGHLQLQEQQAADAVKTFETLRELNDKRYRENVEWFLTLAYLRAGNEIQANRQIGTILQDEKHPYYQDALTLQSHLQRFWRRF